MTDSISRTDAQQPPRPRSISWLLITIGVLVSLLIAALALVIVFRLSNEDAILEDMAQVTQSVSNETVENAASFLAPAERNAAEVANLIEAGLLDADGPLTVDRLFYERLRVNPSFDGIFIGSADGSFLYVQRALDADGYTTKEIVMGADGSRTVRNTNYDANYQLVDSELDPTDGYDPRARPWFQLATEVGPDAGVWTDPYLFFSSGLPGVTRSNAARDPNGGMVVVGIDIRIGELSTFVAEHRASRNGSSYIVDRQLNIVAHPDPSMIASDSGLAVTADLDDPLLTFVASSIADLPKDGGSLRRGAVEGVDYHVVLTSLPNNDDWVIAVAAPDNDFLGRVRDAQRTNRTVTALAGATAVAGLLLGGWLINKRYRQERDLAEAALDDAVARSVERDAARSKLTQTVDQLARSNADLEQYAYATAHDLRTPLRAMGGYAELLLRESEASGMDPEMETYATRIVESYERMCLTMDNLLEHARTSVHYPPEESVALTPIVVAALEDFEAEIDELGVQIEVDDLPDAAVDPIGMVRVFQNLASNAIRYRDPERACEIRVEGERIGEMAVVRFRDNGRGIASQDHERVFQLFSRVSNDAAGTGVGLSLVRKIVEEHGGTIELDSTPGEGSTFVISLLAEPRQVAIA